jgi:hypothetical protein
MAGGQDWAAIWREMYAAERAQGEAVQATAAHADTWATRARRFAAAGRRNPQPDGFMRRLLPELRPDDTLIDVGAGAGRYIPQLARATRRVIAVEPSAAMRAELERLVRAEGLTNVEVLAEPWPAAAPIVADVVISAHVVYGVAEVMPFLQAMDGAARRSCWLALGLRHPAGALNAFWARAHGEERRELPAALEALCCLHQLGIYATMELVPAAPAFQFVDEDDAVEEIRDRLRLPDDQASNALIRAACRDLLAPSADGGLAPSDQPVSSAVIHWSPVPSDK